jgi:hypothetical protein
MGAQTAREGAARASAICQLLLQPVTARQASRKTSKKVVPSDKLRREREGRGRGSDRSRPGALALSVRRTSTTPTNFRFAAETAPPLSERGRPSVRLNTRSARQTVLGRGRERPETLTARVDGEVPAGTCTLISAHTPRHLQQLHHPGDQREQRADGLGGRGPKTHTKRHTARSDSRSSVGWAELDWNVTNHQHQARSARKSKKKRQAESRGERATDTVSLLGSVSAGATDQAPRTC